MTNIKMIVSDFTKEQYLASGWTNETLVEHGKAVYVEEVNEETLIEKELIYKRGSDVLKEKDREDSPEMDKLSTGGFFSSIHSLNFKRLSIELIKDSEGNLTVQVFNKHSVQDEGLSNLKPFSLTGSAKQLDEGFMDMITNPINKTQELIDNTDSYLKALEKAKEEAAFNKAKKDEIKKRQDALSKIIDDKSFDPVKDKSKTEKAIKELKEVDEKNKLIEKAISLITPKLENSLNL